MLLYASLHDHFPPEKIPDCWQTIINLLQRQSSLFTAGEERRLARIIVQLVLSDKIPQEQLRQWIAELAFPDDSPQAYFALVNLENFLVAILMFLEQEKRLDDKVKQAILMLWKGY